MKEERIPHVVIIGAGFGGLRAARGLARARVRVTLVDRQNYHLFQPLLYQVATSALSPDEIAYPIRAIFRRQKNLSFHMGAVQAIDLKNRRVINETGEIPYDYLIVAPGGETNTFGLQSVARNGFGLKTLQDATSIRNHVLAQFEGAAKETSPENRKAMLTFVIAGGGPTGVECAGAIAELVRTIEHKDNYPIDVSEVRVILLEAASRLLAALPETLGQITVEVLERKGVEVRFGAAVDQFDGEQILLKESTCIPARTLIWAAGVRASRLLDGLGLEQDRQGRVKVGPTLQAPGFPEVFVIGDSAGLLDERGEPLPMIAPVAMQQGDAAAHAIRRMLAGDTPLPFRYKDPGILATIGRNQAVARIGRWNISGFAAWVIWVVVHIFQLIGFRNRLAVLLDWAWSYVFYERAARLIAPV